MRFEKGHKAATRQHISMWRRSASAGTGNLAAGITGIMDEAGLTKGAFYPHFGSKDTLVREAVANALADHQHRLDEDQRRGLDLEGAIRSYLNRAHLEDPAGGCPSAALLPEIARQPLPTRKDYEEGLRSYVSTLAALLPDAGPQRAAAVRPPSSASWWEPSSSRGPCLTLRTRSRSSKAALRLRCTWHEFHLGERGITVKPLRNAGSSGCTCMLVCVLLRASCTRDRG